MGLQISYNNEYVHDDLTVLLKPEVTWLSISNSENNELLEGLTAEHTLTVTAEDLSEGNYNAYLMIQSNAGAPLSLPVEIMVGEEGLSGDVNQDNLVDILDVVITVNFVIGESSPTPSEFWAADINDDDKSRWCYKYLRYNDSD